MLGHCQVRTVQLSSPVPAAGSSRQLPVPFILPHLRQRASHVSGDHSLERVNRTMHYSVCSCRDGHGPERMAYLFRREHHPTVPS